MLKILSKFGDVVDKYFWKMVKAIERNERTNAWECEESKGNYPKKVQFLSKQYIFSDISEWNNDYSDTLDFRRG